ncbi:short-chain dehydrogenase [Lysinibacillus sphaericus]|uniref:SDR family NAD(P)-dependent oxidoreductase n=1 Tax=Lysinibacillus sphaericus TaxID=1421 RepID=UPI0018CDBA4E|nr:glucose 1-dehydrogenase [Lysinibacillus sphaericus]MBG9456007.1 short-chain dehydrogenase [Lysinibacillus sphaericus]MBG9479652.1 short-chain dehydrogenase [Lysinibacillus sphaericus]MBG9593866.1 short-chain dehydrogenase [Lysinibacillus sphaericus]
MNGKDFEGRVVLITGAATGIGRATALAFARRGAKVAIGDVDDRAQETVELVQQAGGEAVFFKTDVTSPEQLKLLVEKTVEKFGGLHHAFNNAGVLNKPTKFVDIEEDTFDKVMAVDVKGVFFAVKHELEYMIANGGGTIVNTASVAGVIADPNMAPYVTAKHAVNGLTKAAAIDHAQDGIRVNAVAPGLTETPMTQMWKDNPEVWNEVVSNVPMGRAAKPEEIAEVVVFLSSDAASFCNGYVYVADGGQVAH